MTTTADATTIVKEITIDAPAAKVFAALTEPEQMKVWWGGLGNYQAYTMESDNRTGGRWRMAGTLDDGDTFAIGGIYRVFDAPNVIEMTWKHESEGAETTLVRIELTERNGNTDLRLTHSGFADKESRDQHDDGWTTILPRMAGYATGAVR